MDSLSALLQSELRDFWDDHKRLIHYYRSKVQRPFELNITADEFKTLATEFLNPALDLIEHAAPEVLSPQAIGIAHEHQKLNEEFAKYCLMRGELRDIDKKTIVAQMGWIGRLVYRLKSILPKAQQELDDNPIRAGASVVRVVNQGSNLVEKLTPYLKQAFDLIKAIFFE